MCHEQWALTVIKRLRFVVLIEKLLQISFILAVSEVNVYLCSALTCNTPLMLYRIP